MPTIRIQPLGISVTAPAGVLLRDTLQNPGVLLDYPCGGKGTSRQSRVSVDPAPAAGKGRLKESEYAGGIRLACQLPVTEDCTVSIPEGRLSGQAWKQGLRDTDIATAIGSGTMRRLKIPLPAPSLEDQRADWERLQAGLAEHGITAAAPDAPSLEHISRILRESGWVAEVLCEEDTFLWLDGGTDGRSYGFAVDLGTTTVDIALLDLESGARLSRKAYLNGQVAFGADVISRAQSFHDDRGPVRAAVLRTIDEGAGQILAECGVSASDVVKTVVVGNPIMIHILNGIDPYELTRVPYVAGDRAVPAQLPALLWMDVPGERVRGDPSADLRLRGGGHRGHDRGPGPREGKKDLALHRHRHQWRDGPGAQRGAARHLHRGRARLRGRPDLLRHARPEGGHLRRDPRG